MPLISALRRKKQAGLCEFEAVMVYIVSSLSRKDRSQREAQAGFKLAISSAAHSFLHLHVSTHHVLILQLCATTPSFINF